MKSGFEYFFTNGIKQETNYMKKFFLISLFLTLNILFVYSILRPMNKEVGAIIGRISLKSFTSWKINLYLKNNETGSIFIITPWNNKYYFLLNLKPGSYTLYKFGISLTTSYSITWARDLQLAKDGINIIIE